MTFFYGKERFEGSMPFTHRALPMRYVNHDTGGPGWMVGLEQAVMGSDVIIAPHELQCLTVHDPSELQIHG